MTDEIDADDTLENSDWMRAGAWDLTTPYPECRIVRTLEELRRAIGEDGRPATDAQLRRFLELPAAGAMPKRLRDEIRRAYTRR